MQPSQQISRSLSESYESTPVNNPFNPCIMWLESIRGLFTGSAEDTRQLRVLALSVPDTTVFSSDIADKIGNISKILSRNPQDRTVEQHVASLISDLNPEFIISPGRSRSYSNRNGVFSPSTTPINYSASPYPRTLDFTPISSLDHPNTRNRTGSCASNQPFLEERRESPTNSDK